MGGTKNERLVKTYMYNEGMSWFLMPLNSRQGSGWERKEDSVVGKLCGLEQKTGRENSSETSTQVTNETFSQDWNRQRRDCQDLQPHDAIRNRTLFLPQYTQQLKTRAASVMFNLGIAYVLQHWVRFSMAAGKVRGPSLEVQPPQQRQHGAPTKL